MYFCRSNTNGECSSCAYRHCYRSEQNSGSNSDHQDGESWLRYSLTGAIVYKDDHDGKDTMFTENNDDDVGHYLCYVKVKNKHDQKRK